MKEKSKKFLLLLLCGLVFVEGVGMGLLYFKLRYTQEKIISYVEGLNFILREGGGFRFAVASDYINPEHFAIIHITEQTETPEKIYEFCAHQVRYSPGTTEDNLYDYHVLMESRESNCAGHANLLCALLRTKGFESEHCRVVYGSIFKGGERVNHAWVKLFWNNRWIILDSTNFTPIRSFGTWSKEEFYRTFKVIPVFEYNDTFTNFRLIE